MTLFVLLSKLPRRPWPLGTPASLCSFSGQWTGFATARYPVFITSLSSAAPGAVPSDSAGIQQLLGSPKGSPSISLCLDTRFFFFPKGGGPDIGVGHPHIPLNSSWHPQSPERAPLPSPSLSWPGFDSPSCLPTDLRACARVNEEMKAKHFNYLGLALGEEVSSPRRGRLAPWALSSL